jgi:hypothetical protein
VARTTEQLKKDHDFDNIVAEIIAKRIYQVADLDPVRVKQEVMREINPGIHGLLPDAPDGDSPDDPDKV